MIKPQVYVVLDIWGMYSDYTESVVGVTDDYRQAIGYADRYVKDGDSNYYDGENIVIRAYALNEYDPQESMAELISKSKYPSNSEIVYFAVEDGKWKRGSNDDAE